MFDVLASLEKGSDDYNELNERIICMQGYQQEVIDSVKGCIAKKVPKHWYDYNELKIKDTDTPEIKEWKEHQLKLASYKKPYFFIYNYKHVMNKYKKYISDSNTNSLIRFGLTLEELQEKQNKSDEELDFLKYYELLFPVFRNKSTMNRICWRLEEVFKNINLITNSKDEFDTSIIKSDYTYTKSKYEEIEEIYKEYKSEVHQYMIVSKDLDKDTKKEKRSVFINKFKQKVYSVCSNQYVLTNILVDMCYSNNDSKQFVWDICGDTIIEILLSKNNNKIHYPIVTNDESFDFIWNGEKYKMVEMNINEGDDVFC